jgi:hypothetical protein
MLRILTPCTFGLVDGSFASWSPAFGSATEQESISQKPQEIRMHLEEEKNVKAQPMQFSPFIWQVD